MKNDGRESKSLNSSLIPHLSSRVIAVGMGEGIVTTAPDIISSQGVGSCVIVTLYAPRRKLGGMAHIMLPTAPTTGNEEEDGGGRMKDEAKKGLSSSLVSHPSSLDPSRNFGLAPRNLQFRYANTAIARLLQELQRKGAVRKSIVAKMAGGAQMFPDAEASVPGIGEQSITGVREMLNREGIPLIGQDVGGHHGRGVEFYLESGQVIVITDADGCREI